MEVPYKPSITEYIGSDPPDLSYSEQIINVHAVVLLTLSLIDFIC